MFFPSPQYLCSFEQPMSGLTESSVQLVLDHCGHLQRLGHLQTWGLGRERAERGFRAKDGKRDGRKERGQEAEANVAVLGFGPSQILAKGVKQDL